MGRRELGQLLGLLSNTLLKIDDQQFQNLLNGNAELIYQEKVQSERKEVEEKQKELQQVVDPLSNLIDQLLLSSSREQANQHLLEANLKKDELLNLAKRLNVHITRNDRKNVILEKIVEVMVGSKLRSEAIESIDLK